MKKIIILSAVALLLTACSSEEPTLNPKVDNGPPGTNPYRVSLNEALRNADVLLSDMESATRSGKVRRVESVEYMTNPGTRALGGDTLLYLVNYADDAGFALLSADSRLRPVYAISDEGSLSMSDTTYNKGLAQFAHGVEVDIHNKITNSIIQPGLNDTLIPLVRVVREVPPLLNYHQRRWSQGPPFNQYCFTEDGQQAAVGCAAVAVGMIMSYYSHPASYIITRFDWTTMNNGTNNDDIARLLSILGNSENLNMNYGTTQSGALPSRIYGTFTNMGYYVPNNLQTFSEENVCAILDSSQIPFHIKTGPVLMVGEESRGGHGWVIDGYVQYERISPFIGDDYVLDDILFHCVWGWGGDCNGYFYWEDSFGGVPEELDPNDDNWDNTDYIFDTNVRYMGGFRKVFNNNL